jgi:hypothetical protein
MERDREPRFTERLHRPSLTEDARAGRWRHLRVLDAAAAPEEGAAGDEAVDEDDRPPTAAKKRTRRGSRGGRNRKKKPAATNGDGVSPNTDLETAAVAEAATAVETLGEPVEAQANGDPDVAPVTTAERPSSRPGIRRPSFEFGPTLSDGVRYAHIRPLSTIRLPEAAVPRNRCGSRLPCTRDGVAHRVGRRARTSFR